MKKSIISVVAMILISMQLICRAAVIDSIDETDNGDGMTKTIVVSGQVLIDNSRPTGREVILRIYQKGTTDNKLIEYMGQTTADEDGNYSFKYVKDSESGEYRIEVSYAASSSEPEIKYHNYLSPALFEKFFSELGEIYERKDESEYDAPGKMHKLLINYSEQNVIHIEKMEEMLSEGADITPIMSYILNCEPCSDIDRLIRRFNEGYTLNKINSAGENTLDLILKDEFISSIININADIYKTYLGKDNKSVISKLVSLDYSSVEEFAQCFADEVLVDNLKGKLWQAMYPIIYANNSAIGIDFTEYEGMTEGRQNTAMMSFASNISHVTGTKSCKSVFDKAVDDAKKSGGSNTGSTGGTSGGGNTGGIKITGKDVSPSYVIDTTMRDDSAYENDNAKSYFSDLEGCEWAEEAISYLARGGYVNGDGNGSFRPGDNVTRAEFVKMVIEATRMTNAPKAEISFSDINDGAWYKSYIEKGVGSGIISGVSDTEFAPEDAITRADTAVISMRVLKYFGQEFTQKNIVYSDVTENYAFDSIYKASEAGIMNGVGDNKFEPLRSLTRAEAARVVYNINKCRGEFVE